MPVRTFWRMKAVSMGAPDAYHATSGLVKPRACRPARLAAQEPCDIVCVAKDRRSSLQGRTVRGESPRGAAARPPERVEGSVGPAGRAGRLRACPEPAEGCKRQG